MRFDQRVYVVPTPAAESAVIAATNTTISSSML
jgi:hypothetical protein